MRPDDFKLNTDYLSLATATNFNTAVTFDSGTIGANSNKTLTYDFQAPFAEQVVTNYMISTDGNTWSPSNIYSFNYNSSVAAKLVLQRENNKIVRAYLFIGNGSNSTQSYGSKTFFIKEATLYAPDMN